MNNLYKKIRFPFKFLFASLRYLFVFSDIKNIRVMSKLETIQYLSDNPKLSIARFGDGELEMLNYKNIGFQKFNKQLSNDLKTILGTCQDNHDCLIAMPDGFLNQSAMNFGPSLFWFFHKAFFFNKYKGFLNFNYQFGNTSVTRPYHDYKIKDECEAIFSIFKNIINKKRVLVVEGSGTRIGIGNDLLSNALLVRRITTVNSDAYSRYNSLFDAIEKVKDGFDIVLISLGPTATVLSYNLSLKGIRCFDTGHIDIEYEWMKMSEKRKVAIVGKNVNEAGINLNDTLMNNDADYESQIIKHIS